jgi:acetoin utilization protein AcuB
MIARELISETFPTLNCSDTGKKAIDIMESFRVSHMPIVRDKEYLGLISDKDIYDFDLKKCCFKDSVITFMSPHIKANQHIYEVIQVMLERKITVLPVLELNHDYCGSILINDLSINFLKLAAVNEPGAVIILELSPINYSLSQIAQIVESNNAKIMSLYTKNPEDSMEMNVTLKVNVTEISSIIQTFTRYDYNIKAVYMDDSLITDMFKDRYELFMKYLND